MTAKMSNKSGEVHSFPVTVETVIGTVELSEYGDTNAVEAAYLLIARHESPGTYRFPLMAFDGSIHGTLSVAVEYDDYELTERSR